ncbi:CorA family divalent cation transporter [Marmoricola endophyticus]|uniref:CorA family divalent cation transporter n=1 Tax=Marmoricola endophyticus TaxID=2040280 RepID=UPI001669330D|nr:CorA family divalent cation transporter [Marmoricola endophyticus]
MRLEGLPAALPEVAVSILWVDVQADADPSEAFAALSSLAPTLSLEDVVDLLERDELAKTHDRAEEFRNASFVGFDLQPGPTIDRGPGSLVVQMVETLVGSRLLVSCWQRSRLLHGLDEATDGEPILHEDVVRDACRTWTSQDCETAADLASAVVAGLLVRSRRCVAELEHGLQRWEQHYHSASRERVAVDQADTRDLKVLLSTVNEIRRRLSAFENARLMLRPDEHRFRNAVAAPLETRVDDLMDSGLKRCGVLLEGIRASMELVSMDRVAFQGYMAEQRAQRDQVFQGRLEKVTALLLVPTLIAGIFGANTALPGGGTWAGFDAMLVSMVVTSVAVYVFLVARRWTRAVPERTPG